MIAKIITQLKQIDFLSLRVRLTFGVVTFSTLGLGGVSLWMSWQKFIN